MHRCDRIPKISIQPAPSHHRSPTRSQTVRRHGVGPITVSRHSKIGPNNFPRQHACKPRCDRIPEVSIQPASSHHRSPTRSQTVRRHGLSPTTASRRSKIGHVDQPHHHACKSRSDRIPEVSIQHTACAVAPSLPDTLAYCAPPRGRPHHRFSTVENRSHQLPAPTCVQASV